MAVMRTCQFCAKQLPTTFVIVLVTTESARSIPGSCLLCHRCYDKFDAFLSQSSKEPRACSTCGARVDEMHHEDCAIGKWHRKAKRNA